ncbi:Uncharacterised protein [Vibrio cholerae]|nr:Uncharacterised protein [Vibrio cholerae]
MANLRARRADVRNLCTLIKRRHFKGTASTGR